jgi:hypothetical protein
VRATNQPPTAGTASIEVGSLDDRRESAASSPQLRELREARPEKRTDPRSEDAANGDEPDTDRSMDLTERLLKVPKDELDEARKREVAKTP